MPLTTHFKAVKRAIYASLPFKKLLFTGLKQLVKPKEYIYQHLHFSGLICVPILNDKKILIESRGDISENQLFWVGLNGWHECKSIHLWQRLVCKSSQILDIGANSGIYSLVAARLNPNANIFAFEPIPETIAWFKRNIKANEFNIVAEQLAASDKNGIADIWLEAPGSHYSPSLYNADLKLSNQGVRIMVETVRLDDYFEERGIQRIDLVKIDVERHEPQVLKGMRNLLFKNKPILFIESLDDETGKLIEHELRGLNYLYFNIDETSGSVRKSEHITKSDSYNFLCLQTEHLGMAGLD